MRVHGPPWDYQENEFYKCSINSGQHTGMEAIGVAPTRQKYECAASLAIAVTHALKIQGGSHTAHSDFASVVAKALEAQVDYGNKPEMQSSVPQSDPDPIRFRAQVNKGYDAEASGYLSLQVNDIVYLRNLNMEPGAPSAQYNQYLYGYTKDLSASGSDPLLAQGWFPLEVVNVNDDCFEFDLSTDCYGEKKEVTFS